MKVRYVVTFAILPIVIVLAVLQGGTLMTRLPPISADANPLPALIADHDDIEALLQKPDDPSLRRAARNYLKEVNELLESSDIFVTTTDGNMIAARNYDMPATFVGYNFHYGLYFQHAIKGHRARFHTLGTTSLKRGYHCSSPVEVADQILGAIVFKVDIDSIETSWRGGEYKLFVADPEGTIFMTGSPDWLYTGILPLDATRIARTQASRRYAEAELRALPQTGTVYHGQHLMCITSDGTSREYLRLSHSMPEADWTVNVLLVKALVRAGPSDTDRRRAFLLPCCFGWCRSRVAAKPRGRTFVLAGGNAKRVGASGRRARGGSRAGEWADRARSFGAPFD